MEPNYIYEEVYGTLHETESGIVLAIHDEDDSERIILRYGIEILQTPHAMIPGLFLAERGGYKVGRDAWEWIWSRFQLYPRAEVIGFRSDGKDEHLYMRNLDFGSPVRVMAYEDDQARTPLATIGAVETQTALPELLQRYMSNL